MPWQVPWQVSVLCHEPTPTVLAPSESAFHDMNKLITANPKTTHPIIDCVFPFEEAKAVFTYLSQVHVGKVVIKL
ncbi:hypothetical protein DFH08DRAFT_970426 [Mycena albidolilacea]|uniref:Alcohol dehydrogenase n=1 Tax=Mycena albidolilacea TaxID=1033008 RepID=A0AAD6ZES9_9AGAR|nr:hypothetical protein DFH08DRAFT_970426 [Mycena albidolilacea]